MSPKILTLESHICQHWRVHSVNQTTLCFFPYENDDACLYNVQSKFMQNPWIVDQLIEYESNPYSPGLYDVGDIIEFRRNMKNCEMVLFQYMFYVFSFQILVYLFMFHLIFSFLVLHTKIFHMLTISNATFFYDVGFETYFRSSMQQYENLQQPQLGDPSILRKENFIQIFPLHYFSYGIC